MGSNAEIMPVQAEVIENLEFTPDTPMRDKESLGKLWNVIRSGRSYAEVLDFVDNEIKESTRVVGFDYQVVCFLSDGAYAVSKAVERKMGFTKQANNKGPSGDRPPRMIDISFADGSHTKVPFGKINLPYFGEDAFVDMNYDSEKQIMFLRGQCEKRYVRDMDAIIDETKRVLREESIYKGQAIKFVNGSEPEFINLSKIDKSTLYLTPEAKFATEPIEARIEKTDECIKNKIDIKYGVLLEGTYGTGKTLYAFKLARKAIMNGWTFVYCKNPEDTLDAMTMAQRYCGTGKGVVLFIEDIDNVLDKRDEYTNEISLLMDGGESKNINLITVFTTNHIERIEPTFLRGKRIGSIVTLTHPDKETAKTIILDSLKDSRGNSLVDGTVDNAAEKIVELQIVPAFISEIIDRVKTHLVFSGRKTVTEDEILLSITAYERQMTIAKLRTEETPAEIRFVDLFRELMVDKLIEGNAEIKTAIGEVKEKLE